MGVLPCIDAAVKEMKHGETSIISAPASWAYGSPEYVPPAAPPAAPSAANGVSADGTVDEGDAELVEVSDAASNAASDAVAAPIDRSSVGDVEVRLTLLSFERGKEIYQMTGGEKLAKQAHFKQQGNRCYQGELRPGDQALRGGQPLPGLRQEPPQRRSTPRGTGCYAQRVTPDARLVLPQPGHVPSQARRSQARGAHVH